MPPKPAGVDLGSSLGFQLWACSVLRVRRLGLSLGLCDRNQLCAVRCHMGGVVASPKLVGGASQVVLGIPSGREGHLSLCSHGLCHSNVPAVLNGHVDTPLSAPPLALGEGSA